MAVDKKISQLASGAPAQAGDEYVVARSGANYKLTLTNIAASMPPIGATTPNTGAFTTLSASSGATISGGNLTFSSTAQRITGDMTSALTTGNPLAFQTSTANSLTQLYVIPNGTSKSSYLLLGSGTSANENFFQIGLNNGGSVAGITSGIFGTGTYLPMTFNTGGSERVRIDTSGNVGIGTASPGAKLDISNGQFRLSAAYQVQWFNGATQLGSILCDSGPNLTFQTGSSNTERMRIDSSGNVGIGTASPGSLLHISSGTTTVQRIEATSTNGAYITYKNNGSDRMYCGTENSTGAGIIGTGAAYAGVVTTASTNPLVFGTNGTERMRIDSSGRVIIGATSATLSGETFKFLLNQAGGTLFGLNNANNTNQTWSVLVLDSGLGAAGRFTLTQIVNGSTAGLGGGPQVPIIQCDPPATANTTPRLFINGDGEVVTGGLTDNGAYNLQCNGTGVWGAGAYVNGSDARLKDDITTLNDGLNVVSQLRPVTFKYKPDYSKDQNVQTGFIAQELQAVLAGKDYVDGIVQAGPNHLNVAYQSLIPILVKAIQELTARVAELEAK